MFKKRFLVALAASVLSSAALANEHEHDAHAVESGAVCTGFGPQTPRDIDSKSGDNKVVFAMAASTKQMNLCNIHFHKNAEHKAKDYSIHAEGEHGTEGGYQCNSTHSLTKAELAPTAAPICAGEHGSLQPGDTIEVHWVHTTNASSKPGPNGLGDCLAAKDAPGVANPDLRVEAQVFVLVNDPKAGDFTKLGAVTEVNGYQQAANIPSNTGKPVLFIGSTTGPKWNNQTCSPMQVTWSVRPQCAKLDINSVGKWCEQTNMAADKHAHGVRTLVTDKSLLSVIK